MITQARRKTVQCLSPAGLHRMAYKEWGDPLNPEVLVCVHGVTRVSDDFDAMAEALCGEYRVICPDVVGRGRSDRLRNPQFYQIPQYVADMVTLIARLDVPQVRWFGTSMGGLIGLGLGALESTPISKLVLNDIGPTLNVPALTRIGQYIGEEMRFDSYDDAVRYIRDISQSFGPHSEEAWAKLAADVLVQDPDGKWIRHYDLRLAEPFKATTPETIRRDQAMLWAAYDALKCPTLVIRGAESDLLSAETAQEMTQRGPSATVVELPGIGHAPTFVTPEQIAIVRGFLRD